MHVRDSTNNLVGGDTTAKGNTVAFNASGGVVVSGADAAGNAIRRNSLFANGGLGIDLTPSGVTANDPGDADSGPNGLQNFPVLTNVVPGASTQVAGSLNSRPGTTYTLDFYASNTVDPSGHGEGQRYLGSALVTTDAGGNATFAVTLAAATTAGQVVTATATDPDGNTSEFSAVFSRCSVGVVGSVLTIQGDNAPNAIQLHDLGGQRVRVVCDGTPTAFTQSIDQIVVRTVGGDDIVRWLADDLTVSWAGRLDIDTGGGADDVSLGAPHTVINNPGAALNVRLVTGDGDDRATVRFHKIVGSYTWDLHLGAHNDTLTFLLDDYHGVQTLSVLGEGGNDSIAARVGFNPQPDPPGHDHGWTSVIDGGTGDDDVTVGDANQYAFGRSVTVNLGDGNDRLTMETELHLGAAAPPSLRTNVQGGTGNDTFIWCVTGAWRGVYQATYDLGAGNDNAVFGGAEDVFQGDLALTVAAGAGADRVAIRFRDLSGSLTLDARLGADNDTLSVEIDDYNGMLTLRADGEAGNDTKLARVGFIPQPDPPGRRHGLNVTFVGGIGHDTVMVGDSNHFELGRSVTVDLGAGNDTAVVETTFTAGTAPPPFLRTRILGGEGNDRVTVRVNGDTRSLHEVTADLGGGDDQLDYLHDNPDIMPAPTSLAINLGDGRDVLNVLVDHPEIRILAGALNVIAHGGRDADTFTVRIQNVTFHHDPVLFNLFGDDGTDTFQFQVQNVSIHNPDFFVSLHGGGSADLFNVAFQDVTYDHEDNRVAVNVFGDDGNDQANVRFAGVAFDDPEHELAVSLLMGRGNDVGSVLIDNPDERVTGLLDILLDGQDGHDRLAVNLTAAADSTGPLNARVLGGGGNDDLTLVVSGWGGAELVNALIDGAGRDTAHHTPNVLVRKVEQDIVVLG